MNQRRNLIAAAALSCIFTAPAYAVLERVGPTDNAPAVGGFASWYQDKTGITFEFCDVKTLGELDGGWCVLLPGDINFPEVFPNNFFDEHFYYVADNTMLDLARGFRARLRIAMEAAFANGPAVPGDQITFARLRVQTTGLPFDGNYRVITPFSDTVYQGQVAGDRIFDTLDIGAGCQADFTCAINGAVGPYLLPSAAAGGAELPPMPDLRFAPVGTDPFYDQAVAAGAAPTADPGTGKKYVADPGRVGAVTGSPLAPFLATEPDGSTSTRDHNTFRIEVSDDTGKVFYSLDGETNFGLSGRLKDGALEGNVGIGRAVYKADGAGKVTAIDVFTTATPAVQARMPAQPQVPAVKPILAFYDEPCGGAISIDPLTGLTRINEGPYTAPAVTAHSMLTTGNDYWGQSTPGGLPPSHVCIADTNAKNAAGQTVPVFFLRKLTDEVTVGTASFNGLNNGTLSVSATSSDPTALLTLAGYGPGGTGVDLAGTNASVSGLQAPPSVVQVVSSKGGTGRRDTDTGTGTTVLLGVPTASADFISLSEDCSAGAAASCAPGQAITVDLLQNDTILLNGVLTTLRNVVASNLGTVVVTADAARLGTATVSPTGILSYTPNANANGTDSIGYTVSVNGTASNPSQVSIIIAAVNDPPVAGNTSTGAVQNKQNVVNLIANSTDPDGNGDVKEAVLLTWPTQLGARPTPLNGVINYTPTALGAFSFTYQVKDVAGALSLNTATGTVTVAPNEVITFGKHQFVQSKNRWTVDGTDNVIEGQTITIVYENGLLVGATAPCNGTATNPNCVIGTSPVDGLGAWGLDKVGVNGTLNPKAGASIWQVPPTFIRAFSTLPALGGTVAIDIVFK